MKCAVRTVPLYANDESAYTVSLAYKGYATAHVLRHSLLTLASNSGVEPKMIQALAGHSNVAFTLNQYVHAQESQLTKTAGKISAAIAAM